MLAGDELVIHVATPTSDKHVLHRVLVRTIDEVRVELIVITGSITARKLERRFPTPSIRRNRLGIVQHAVALRHLRHPFGTGVCFIGEIVLRMVVRVEAIGENQIGLEVLVAGAGGKFGNVRLALFGPLTEPFEIAVRPVGLGL